MGAALGEAQRRGAVSRVTEKRAGKSGDSLAERKRQLTKNLAKPEEGKEFVVPEFQCRGGASGKHWLEWGGSDQEMP